MLALNRTLHFLCSVLRLNQLSNLLYCSPKVRVLKSFQRISLVFVPLISLRRSFLISLNRSLQQCVFLWGTSLASWPDTSILEHNSKLCPPFQRPLYTKVRKSITSVYTYFWPQEKKCFAFILSLSSFFPLANVKNDYQITFTSFIPRTDIGSPNVVWPYF